MVWNFQSRIPNFQKQITNQVLLVFFVCCCFEWLKKVAKLGNWEFVKPWVEQIKWIVVNPKRYFDIRINTVLIELDSGSSKRKCFMITCQKLQYMVLELHLRQILEWVAKSGPVNFWVFSGSTDKVVRLSHKGPF